ncbi:MAG: hypothetical protein ACP5QR_15660 [Rhizomicrobium sp.]
MRHTRGLLIISVVALASAASAASRRAEPSRLKPGHAATVHKAQDEMIDEPAMWVVGGAVVVGGVALAVSSGHNHTPVATTTSTPSTTSSTSTTGTSGK